MPKRLYLGLVNDLNPQSTNDISARMAFGSLLHVVQDFYAHSNWIEIGRNDLVDDSLDEWSILQPFSIHKGIVIIEGSSFPQGYSISRQGKLVTVNISGQNYAGLITGKYDEEHLCPLKDQLGNDFPIHHDELNKDESGRPGFASAKALAVKQTRHEWCRLVKLVQKQWGKDGVDNLFRLWVDENKFDEAKAACSESLNVALIIDETGSMSSNDPLGRRKDAAKAFVDAARPGDRIAVIGFDTSIRDRLSAERICQIQDEGSKLSG